MKYDLYITNESRLSSPNANMVFKLGVGSVVLTIIITVVTWLHYNGYVHDFAYSITEIEYSSEAVIQNAPKIVEVRINSIKMFLRGIHWFLLLLGIFYYLKAVRKNESSLWVAWGVVLVASSIFHTYSIGEFYSIEFGVIDIARMKLENRVNKW